MGTCCSDPQDRHLPTIAMDNFIRRLISPPAKKISEISGFIQAGSTVADVGCGPGYFTIPIAELLGPKGRVYALDSNPEAVLVLNAKSVERSLQGVIDARVGSAAGMKEIADASVDFVFANGVLCCMADHRGAIAEIKRILKPTGYAYLSVTKVYRRKDQRAVRKEEWSQILEEFKVEDSHEGLLNRWAIVSAGAVTAKEP